MRGISLVKSRSVTSRSSTMASTARRAATLSFLAVVMTFSTQRRSSLPLASVVSIRPWSSRDVTRLRLIALRCAVLRLNLRPAFWCRTRLGLLDQDLGQLFRREEAALHQFFFDLVQRLPAEVAQAQKILLAQGHQLADLGDLVGLQAVQRPNRAIEVLDRQVRQSRGEVVPLLLRHVGVLDPLGEAGEEAQVRGELLGRLTDGLVGHDRPVRPDLEDQPVPVGLLTDAGLLDQEIRLDDRTEDGVDRNHADRLAFFLVPLGGHVALAAFDRQLHAEAALVAVERADVELGVDDLDITRRLDVGRLHLAGTGDVQREPDRIVAVGDQVQPLEVEDDLGDVLLVEAEPGTDRPLLARVEGVLDAGDLFARVLDRDHIADAHGVGGDVDGTAVDGEVAVGDELAGVPPRCREADAVDDVVEPRLQEAQQVEAGDAGHFRRPVEVESELALEQEVDAARALLGSQLDAVVRHLAAADLGVHAGRHRPTVEGALREALLSLEEELDALATAVAADRAFVAGHLDAPPLRWTATVVRDGRDVGDRGDLESGRLQGSDGGLAAGSRALDEDLDLLEAVLHGAAGRCLGRDLGGKGRA